MERGEDFGHYRLQRLIGSGGMGDVYEAVDLDRERVVALKLLPELFSSSAEFKERFRRESRIVARLRDPHIIPIHDYGEIDSRLYIDMRLVDNGVTLADLIRDEGPLGSCRAVAIVEQIAEALDAAHREGLLHRDIKPSNVLVTARDFVYVVDFGIAHVMGQTAHGLTGSNLTVGTLDYMAPERFAERTVGPCSDVYSLACLLHECLTTRKPFAATSAAGLMYAHCFTEPPSARAAESEIPVGLDEVIRLGMAKEPGDRFATAGELAAAARAALTPLGRVAPTPGSATSPIPSDHPARASEAVTAVHTPAEGGDAATSFAPVGTLTAAPSGSTPRPSAPAGHPATGPPRPSVRPARARLWMIGGACAAGLIVVGLIVALLPSSPRDPSPARPGAAAGPVPGPVTSVATPAVLGSIATPPEPGYVTVDPGGQRAYATHRAPRLLSVIDLVTRRPETQIPMPSTPRFVTVSPDGTRAFVSCYDAPDTTSTIAFVDLRSNRVTGTVDVAPQPYAIALAPDQRTLWVPSHRTASLDIVDTLTGQVTGHRAVAPNPHWIVFAGPRAYVINHESNLVTVMDTATATPTTTIPVGRSPHAAALSPDGGRLAVVDYDGNDVSMIDTSSDHVIATFPTGAGPQNVAWAPDGRHLYTADVDGGTVSTIDATTGARTASTPVGPSPTSIALLPGGSTALVTILDGAQLALLGIGR